MAGASTTLHEAVEQLTPLTRDLHRAIVSLQEELEAVDWYRQRAEAADDPELKEVLLHNMGEEIEHATMLLEWIRRHEPLFDRQLRTYLFKDVPIVAIEEAEEKTGDGGTAAIETSPPSAPLPASTIGSMKGA
jgi:hypothetical protein